MDSLQRDQKKKRAGDLNIIILSTLCLLPSWSWNKFIGWNTNSALYKCRQCTLTLVISERNKDISTVSRALAQDFEKEKCLQMLLMSKPVGELPWFSRSIAFISSQLSRMTPKCSLHDLQSPGPGWQKVLQGCKVWSLGPQCAGMYHTWATAGKRKWGGVW